MTTIAGVGLGDVLYFGSDRLFHTLHDGRKEGQKIYHKRGFVVGCRGDGSESGHKGLLVEIARIAETGNISELLAGNWVRFTLEYNQKMRKDLEPLDYFAPGSSDVNTNYLIGVCSNGDFAIYFDAGRGNSLQRVGNAAIIFPDGEEFNLELAIRSEDEARKWLIDTIREKNRKYPDACSGIEIFKATHQTSERIFHEPIDPSGPKHEFLGF